MAAGMAAQHLPIRSHATLTGRRGGHTPFVQAGAETSDTAEAVKPDPGASWEGHSEGLGTGVGDK